jgi:hypothetical protein
VRTRTLREIADEPISLLRPDEENLVVVVIVVVVVIMATALASLFQFMAAALGLLTVLSVFANSFVEVVFGFLNLPVATIIVAVQGFGWQRASCHKAGSEDQNQQAKLFRHGSLQNVFDCTPRAGSGPFSLASGPGAGKRPTLVTAAYQI